TVPRPASCPPGPRALPAAGSAPWWRSRRGTCRCRSSAARSAPDAAPLVGRRRGPLRQRRREPGGRRGLAGQPGCAARATGRHGGGHVEIVEALADELTTLVGAAGVLAGDRQLQLQPLERAQVHLALLGQLAEILLLVRGDLLLLGG